MGTSGIRWIGAAVAALGLALAGCGDSNVFEGQGNEDSTQAKKEAGLEALNDGDWAKAQKVFDELYDSAKPDPEIAKYLASAYVMEAGFDTLALVDEIAKAQDAGDDGASIIYESVTKIFDTDGNGTITASELSGEGGKIELLRQAISYLAPGYGQAGRVSAARAQPGSADDQTFQAGMYAAVHAVLSVVGQLRYPAGSETLLLTLDQLDAHWEEVRDNIVVPETLDADLGLVNSAKDVLLGGLADGADQNDIAAEFEKFLAEIGYSDDGIVTTPELVAYLDTLVQSYRDGNQQAVQ